MRNFGKLFISIIHVEVAHKSIYPKTRNCCVCFLIWKKLLIWSKRKKSDIHWDKYPWVFNKGRVFHYRGVGGFPSCLNFQKFPLLSDASPPLPPPLKNWAPSFPSRPTMSLPWSHTTYWENGISNNFYTNLTKHFENYDLFEKAHWN